MTRIFATSAFAVLLAGTHAYSQDLSPLPPYQPKRQVSGVIRIWGHGTRQVDYMGGLVQAWETGFKKIQLGVSFRNELNGDDSALGGVYTSAADLALLVREPLAIEDDGFEQALGYKPFGIRVAYGSVRTQHQAPALVVFVHRSNPLARLTLAQLDGIFGADRRRGSPPILHWSDLGIEGAQGSRPIHLYGFGIGSSETQFFEKAVLKGSQKWNCNLHEFRDGNDGSEPAAVKIAAALAKDPDGIAISTLEAIDPAIKPLDLGNDANGPYEMPDENGVRSGEYPLTRTVYFYFNRKLGNEIDATLKEFLDFVVSADGQALIDRPNSYLPLSPALSLVELK